MVVFAYRAKTPAAPGIAAALERRLASPNVRFTGELPDVLALVAGAAAVLFPVDDLHGKVDLPIVLLESMSLGIPVIALDHGPLADLGAALRLAPGDTDALARAALSMIDEPARRAEVAAAGRAEVQGRYRAEVVAAAYERLYEELMTGP